MEILWGRGLMSGWLGLGGPAALACAMLASGGASAKPLARDQCRLELPSRFIGAKAVPTVRRAIRDIAKPRPVRWIIPGRAIRPDFHPKRLNVILDETGRIMNMRCG